MGVDIFINLLYWYFLPLQVFLKKVDIFVNLFENCLVRASLYYYNYMPSLWEGIPPPSDRKHRREAEEHSRQK